MPYILAALTVTMYTLVGSAVADVEPAQLVDLITAALELIG